MSYVWETDNLVKEFTLSGGLFKPKQTVHAVQGVSLYQSPGETLGIVGESGCGKSTFGYTLMGLYQATSGSIYMNGQYINPYVDRKAVHPVMQMVFQNPNSTFSPRMNIGDFLCEGMLNFKLAGKKEALKKAKEYLELVKLPTDIMERLPHQLSGGQLQRVVIARALTLSPEVLIYDESTAALDVSVQQDVLKLMYDLRKSCDNSVIFICHDLAAVRLVADRIIVMYNGKIVEIVESRNLVSESKEEYTKKLIGSVFEVN